MNLLKRRALPLLLAVLLVLPCLPAAAMGAAADLYDVRALCSGSPVSFQEEDGETYLFLPASADVTALVFDFQGDLSLSGIGPVAPGQPVNLAAVLPQPAEDGTCPLTVTHNGVTTQVKVMHSANIPAFFITSEDPVNKGMAWTALSKDNKTKGAALMVKADGSVLYDGAFTQLKGRGNSTWQRPKKPYQIKLESAVDLMECNEPSKTWVLLANYFDKTLIRNRMCYELAEEMGLDYSPHCRPVDLYYDGVYAGSYLLSEKTELAKNRVDLHNLEDDIQAANPEVDFDTIIPAAGMTVSGNLCQYVEGLAEPEDVSGGYLIEVDLEDRAKEEATWFSTPMGLYITVKSPEFATRNTLRYLTTIWQYFEDAVTNGGVHPRTGQPYTAYMDEVSLAKLYLIMELAMNGDAFRTSTYFYKPENEDVLYAGPVWDYDLSFGLGFTELDPRATVCGKMPIGKQLIQLPSFRKELFAQNQELHHLVRDILLSNNISAHGRILRSLQSYDAEIAPSRLMDQVLWPATQSITKSQTTTADLMRIMDIREDWLYNSFQESTGFRDVHPSDWFADSVDQVVSMGLFQGVNDQEFQPATPMTRGMVATVLYRMAGSPQTRYAARFQDVASDRWYTDAVMWASDLGVVNGYPDGTFRASAPITRQELVTVFYHYVAALGQDMAAPALTADFADRNHVPLWAASPFAWAVDRGLVTGTPSGNVRLLDPGSPTPRSQGAALFLRLSQMLGA